MEIKNKLIRIMPNIGKMLLDRGYDTAMIPPTEYNDILEYKINEFVTDEDESRILDMIISTPTQRDYVFFYKGHSQVSDGRRFKAGASFFKRLTKYSSEVVKRNGFNINYDNITFVLAYSKLSETDIEAIDNYESKHPHIRIFDYCKFLISITDHVLVPKHAKYTESYSELLARLMIASVDQLPYIMYNDPMSKHMNFRNNEIVEIERPTLGKNIKIYRVCKNFNYSHMHIEDKFEPQKEDEMTMIDRTMSTSVNVPPEDISIEWDSARYVQFYSDSKASDIFSSDELRYLSNFAQIRSDDGSVTIDENSYSTIEHYFQAQKFLPQYHVNVTPSTLNILETTFAKFLKGGKFDVSDSKPSNKWGLLAKSQGGANAMKRLGLTSFNTTEWNSRRIELMTTGIKSRFKQDLEFKKIMIKVKKYNRDLYHFERSGTFWGGNLPKKYDQKFWVGENRLGVIMNTIIKQYRRKKRKIKVRN